MPQPPIDGTLIPFFGRTPGKAGIVARWRKTGIAYDRHWESPSGVKMPAFDWDRWEAAELPKPA